MITNTEIKSSEFISQSIYFLKAYNTEADESELENMKYQYTGKEKDGLGIYYYGARYYDPELGRFLQPDKKYDGQNRYAYCQNNPVIYNDPEGESALLACAIFVYAAQLYFNGVEASGYNYNPFTWGNKTWNKAFSNSMFIFAFLPDGKDPDSEPEPSPYAKGGDYKPNGALVVQDDYKDNKTYLDFDLKSLKNEIMIDQVLNMNNETFQSFNFEFPVPIEYNPRWTTDFGPDFFYKSRYHPGIDIAPGWDFISSKTIPIVAAHSGKISVAYDDAFGQNVSISSSIYGYRNSQPITYKLESKYSHLQRNVLVKNGQYVNKGQVLGYMGKTGFGNGVHLDFRITINGFYIDPIRFYPDRGGMADDRY